MIRGLPLFDQRRNDLILLTQLPFGHVDSDSGIPKLFPILSVRKPGIVIVFMGNRTMIDLLCAAIADIRSFVQSAATFFSKSLQVWLQVGQEAHFTPQRIIIPHTFVFLQ